MSELPDDEWVDTYWTDGPEQAEAATAEAGSGKARFPGWLRDLWDLRLLVIGIAIAVYFVTSPRLGCTRSAIYSADWLLDSMMKPVKWYLIRGGVGLLFGISVPFVWVALQHLRARAPK